MTADDLALHEFDNIPTKNKFSNDPEFLCELGKTVYNWSRIESALSMGLKLRIAGASNAIQSRGIPVHFGKKLDLWKQLHKKLPALSDDKKEALALATAAKELSKDREVLIHGSWRSIVKNEPFTIQIHYRRIKGSKTFVYNIPLTTELLAHLNEALEHHAQSWNCIIVNLRGPDLDKYRESPLPPEWPTIHPEWPTHG